MQGFVETLVVDVSVPQAAEVPAPQFRKPVVGVKAPPQRVPQRIVEKEVSFPQLWEKIVEVTQLVLPERLQARVGKQMVVVLVPPISRK